MTRGITERIKTAALRALSEHPEGLRYSELLREIQSVDATFKSNTIQGCIWNLDATSPAQVYKPSRGLFQLLRYRPSGVTDTPSSEPAVAPQGTRVREEDFYAPFAHWLQNEVEDATKAIPLGRNKFKDKWGTPDVVGKYESRVSDIIKATTEIVSAEIKIDSQQVVTAFGQACAYKLFSHRVYLAVPDVSQKEEISRLESLCQVMGLGLVTFDANSPEAPNFTMVVRAMRHDPDLFYTNKYMRLVERELFQ